MNTKKGLAFAVGGLLLVGGLAGARVAASPDSAADVAGVFGRDAGLPGSMFCPDSAAGVAGVSGRDAGLSGSTPCSDRILSVAEVSSECTDLAVGVPADACGAEGFEAYGPFGLLYDAGKNELWFRGKAVRWFEDYYPVSEDGAQAGRDFFNEDGVVDVYAVRDQSDLVRAEDGSFDPSGKLVGVKEFSAEEFAARDIGAIKNPRQMTAVCGGLPSGREMQEIAREYGAFGVVYDAKEDQWYWNGEKVRFFRDVMTSNGESLTGGKFHGTMRILQSREGGIDIYTVRDFGHLDADGNGTLVGIEKFSQEEFDARTSGGVSWASAGGLCEVRQGEEK